MVWSDCEHTLGKTRVLGVLRLRLREQALGKTHVCVRRLSPPPPGLRSLTLNPKPFQTLNPKP